MSTPTTEALLLSRIEELESRLTEADELIEAIKTGEVDAFALNRNNRSEIFTLESGDYAYRLLIENIREGTLNLTESGLIVYTNNYFSSLLHRTYQQVIGTSIFDLIHESCKEKFAELFTQGLSGQTSGEILLSTGEITIPAYISLTSLAPTLPTVGMIVTDLSAKKNQDKILEDRNNELILANDELSLSRSFIKSVLESTEYGVLSYTAIREGNQVVDFKISFANERALVRLKRPYEEVIGERYLSLVPTAKERGLWQLLLRVHQTRVSEMHEIQAPEDPNRWFMVHHAPLHDGVTCTFVEITHQKQQAAALNQKNEDLAKSNAELASFNYIASHDLQEPLRKIRMFSSSLIESNERELSDKGKSMLVRMNIAAERMQILINDLLLYSRTKSHEEEFEVIALQKLIEEVQQDLSEELQEKKAVIDADGLPKIKVLPFQFRQLLHNLIGNALKYSKPDIAPYITIRSKIAPAQEFPNMTLLTDRTYCHISFSDNGIGFEPQYSEKIFNVFQRLHGKDQYSGTGIGLSIVKRIVENHQGIITAQGEINKGATFNIFIPC